MGDVIESLKQREKVLHDLQQKKARQEGQRQQLLQQLKTEFGVDTIDDAINLLMSMQTEVEQNEKELIQLDTEMAQIIANACGQ